MSIKLSGNDVKVIWDNDAVERTAQIRRAEYYDGDQDILDASNTLIDGSDRNKIVTNWIRYIVDKHVGFIAARPFSYTLVDKNADTEPVRQYSEIARYNNLPALNAEHLKSAILRGSSLEVHSFQNKQIVITSYSPQDWGFLYDENKNLLAAVYRVILAVGTYYDNKILEDEVVLYTLYNDKEIVTYEQDNNDNLDVVKRQSHQYGRIPVVIFSCSENMDSFITNDIITQQNVWNTIRSANADDVVYNVHALLMTKGIKPDAFYELDNEGVSYWQKMQQNKHLPLSDPDCDAKFLTRGNQPDKVTLDLETTRGDIHRMGRVVDVAQMTSATGRTSGIALKLKLQPQIEQANIFTKYFENGLRERIDLINIIWKKLKRSLLTDYTITFNYNIPVNETEVWQHIGDLKHLLSREDQLRLIPSIDDPIAAAKAKEEELLEDIKNGLLQAEQDTVTENRQDINEAEEGGEGL